jgi:hypothetical protein
VPVLPLVPGPNSDELVELPPAVPLAGIFPVGGPSDEVAEVRLLPEPENVIDD